MYNHTITTKLGRKFTVASSVLRGADDWDEWKVILTCPQHELPTWPTHGADKASQEETEEFELDIVNAIHEDGLLPFVKPMQERPFDGRDCSGLWYPDQPAVCLWNTNGIQHPDGDRVFPNLTHIEVSQASHRDV